MDALFDLIFFDGAEIIYVGIILFALFISIPFNCYGWSSLISQYYTIFDKPIYSVISEMSLNGFRQSFLNTEKK